MCIRDRYEPSCWELSWISEEILDCYETLLICIRLRLDLYQPEWCLYGMVFVSVLAAFIYVTVQMFTPA